MLKKLFVKDLSLGGKRVLVRVDFNVPLDKNLQIIDDTRIVAALPTLKYILDAGASLVIMSHLGRPSGKVDASLSLFPCVKRLSELLGRDVLMARDCIGPETEAMAHGLKPGEVLILENLRFHIAEEKPDKDPKFVEKLASLADIYVNDAFGTSHREHSSTIIITKYFPGCAAAGFLLEKEVVFLSKILQNPPTPFCAIIGGKKVDSKLGILKSLVNKTDVIFIGGGMSYTFLKARGFDIGDSICDDVALANEILSLAKDRQTSIVLPVDIVIADQFSNDANLTTIDVVNGVPDGWQGMDIGKRTIEFYKEGLKGAKMVFWNGPLGVFEFNNFAKGTFAIAEELASLDAVTIIGGGESVAAVKEAGVLDKMTHISTGGGASLEYIEFGTLPGIEALSNV